jgi:outer membrane protein, adhesin transport system
LRKILVFIFSVIPIFANTSFEDLISKLIKNHPSISMSKEAIKSSKEGINNAKWQYFPTPSVEFSRGSNSNQTVVKLEQPLWTAGKLDANYNKALTSEKEALFELEEKKYKLIEMILIHSQNYIQAKYSKKALNSGLERLKSFSDMIDRKIRVGLSTIADKRLLESRLTQIKSDLISIVHKEKTALKQISLLLGEEITEIDFADNISIEGINTEELINKIDETNPILSRYEQKIKSAIYEIDKQEASLYPTLTVAAEHRKGDIYTDNYNTSNNAVYLKLQSQFGAGLSSFSNIKQAKIELQRLKYEKQTIKNELIDDFWQDYNNMLVSKNKIGNTELNEQLSKEVFESNKRLFLADRKQWLDLVNSSKELMDIDIALADSKAMYMISKYKVALKSGLINLDNGDYPKSNIQSLRVEEENINRDTKEILIPMEKTKEKELLKNITFKSNSIQIDKIFVNDLKKLVQFMKENKSSTLKLIGHSDKTVKSTKKYNQELARKRVKNVASWLQSNGIEKQRISYMSKGFEMQVAKNHIKFGNELNRRVEFIISNKGNN